MIKGNNMSDKTTSRGAAILQLHLFSFYCGMICDIQTGMLEDNVLCAQRAGSL